MKSVLNWIGGMKFEATADGKSVTMDAKSPIGTSSAQTPKEFILDGLGGCTAMDVVALLKKHKQSLTSFEITVDVTTTKSGHPVTFTSALITFKASGAIEPKILLEAVRLSQTQYCGVSAMLSKAFPIEYIVELNDEEIGRGKADFKSQ
jgi:putative redox protein